MLAVAVSSAQTKFKNLNAMALGTDSTVLVVDTTNTSEFDKGWVEIFKQELKKNKYTLIFVGTAALAEAHNELADHDWERLNTMYGGHLDPSFFNNAESWKRKWKNGDPSQGEAFLGSSGPLVMLTDFKHLTNFIENVSYAAGILTFRWTIGDGAPLKYKLKVAAANLVMISGVKSLVFNFIYHGVAKHPLFKQ